MLYRIEKFSQIDAGKLMDLYQEGNLENIDYFYPGTDDREGALKQIERNFLEFVEKDFLAKPGNTYWILEEEGVWVSALRLSKVEDGFYYMEALETHPRYRRKGYAVKLLESVIDALKEEGSFKICDCVRKWNTASLAVHEKCGFEIVSDRGMDYIHGEEDENDYGLQYRLSRQFKQKIAHGTEIGYTGSNKKSSADIFGKGRQAAGNGNNG